MDEDDPTHDDLRRALDLYGEGVQHDAQGASNEASIIAAFYLTLEANDVSEDACIHLTTQWMRLGHPFDPEAMDA